jgi:hypothetical protein
MSRHKMKKVEKISSTPKNLGNLKPRRYLNGSRSQGKSQYPHHVAD